MHDDQLPKTINDDKEIFDAQPKPDEEATKSMSPKLKRSERESTKREERKEDLGEQLVTEGNAMNVLNAATKVSSERNFLVDEEEEENQNSLKVRTLSQNTVKVKKSRKKRKK